MTNNKQILDLMVKTAEQSAQLIRSNFRQSDEYQDKSSHIDIVTATDTASQKNIHEMLVSGMKNLGFSEDEVGFVEEESGNDSVKKHNFIVDPIDGTTNFASGIPFSCISIGYATDHDIKIGVVLEPFSKTLYWGEAGEGSFVKNELLGKRRLQLKMKPEKSWIIGAHLNGLDVVDAQFETYQRIYPHVRGLRNIGSLTLDLCFMADNVIDVVFNQGCYFWDLAAASILLKEAGGQIYDYSGQDLEFDWSDTKKKYHVMACHPSSLEKVVEFVK